MASFYTPRGTPCKFSTETHGATHVKLFMLELFNETASDLGISDPEGEGFQDHAFDTLSDHRVPGALMEEAWILLTGRRPW